MEKSEEVRAAVWLYLTHLVLRCINGFELEIA